MPIESSAVYLNTLVPANPGDTDPAQQGAAHLRLLKLVLQNTFPGITAPWVTSYAVTFGGLAVNGNGTVSGTFGVTGNTTLAGAASVGGALTVTGQANVGSLTTAGLIVTSGNLQANGSINTGAAGTTPASFIGEVRLAHGVGIPAGWQQCDGTNGTPNLLSVQPGTGGNTCSYIKRIA